MKLVVCPLQAVASQVRRHRPSGVVTLLAPDQPGPRLAGALPSLRLSFHDVAAAHAGLTAPDAAAIDRLLDFAAAQPDDATLLVHCWMGISRSPAAAFILACAASPGVSEETIARRLRGRAPSATPNLLMVELADAHLGRHGRMVEAILRIGRGADAATGPPFEFETLQRADPRDAAS
jgi:predicted protein tyrosine phosphatase